MLEPGFCCFAEMKTLNEMLSEEMKNDEFRKEYEVIQPEFDVIRAMVDARNSVNMTQKEISERTGMTLKIEFVPKYGK